MVALHLTKTAAVIEHELVHLAACHQVQVQYLAGYNRTAHKDRVHYVLVVTLKVLYAEALKQDAASHLTTISSSGAVLLVHAGANHLPK